MLRLATVSDDLLETLDIQPQAFHICKYSLKP